MTVTTERRIDAAIMALLVEAKGVTLNERQTDKVLAFILTHGHSACELIVKRQERK